MGWKLEHFTNGQVNLILVAEKEITTDDGVFVSHEVSVSMKFEADDPIAARLVRNCEKMEKMLDSELESRAGEIRLKRGHSALAIGVQKPPELPQ